MPGLSFSLRCEWKWTPSPRATSYSSPRPRSVVGVTERLNRGTIATCSVAVVASPVSTACQRSISAHVSAIASSSEVRSGVAGPEPTVWIPRPLTSRSPASREASNRASWACGNADPNTSALVVPAMMRRRVKSAAIMRANPSSSRRASDGNTHESSHSRSWPPPCALVV